MILRLRGSSRAYSYANRLGVSRDTVVRWCRGDNQPTDVTMQKLLNAEGLEKDDFEAYMEGAIDLEELLAKRKGERPRVGDRFNLAAILSGMQSLSVDDLVQIMQEAIALIAHRWRSSGRGRAIRDLVAQYRERSLQCLPPEDVDRLIQGQRPQMHQLIKLSRVLEGFSSEDLLAIAEEEFGEIGKPVEEEEKTNGHCI